MTAIGNLVQQTTTSTGTGNLTLVSSSGRQSFNDAFGTGGTDAFYYFIMHRTSAEWEVGTGHLLDATTLVRDTVINSSNADAAVNFSAGTKDVTNAVAASDVAQLVNLASTANGKGASLIGIEDSGALITATTVEGALAENRAAIDAIEADYLTSSAIGSTVQAYDADTAKYDDVTANFTGTLQNGGSNVLVDSDIGSTVQAYDADLTTWAGITPGTGVGTALAVNVGTAGSFVVNGGALGTPSSGTLTNATGLPVSSGISGLGTGVATALAVAVGSAGALVVNGGALGTPSSGTLTNATGLPISTGVSGLGTGVATFLATPSSANLAAAVTGETGSGALVFGTSPGFTTSANPASNDGATLGTTSLKWSDLFLANGAVINFNSGDVTITHSAANTLTFAGASSGYVFSDGNVGIGTTSPGRKLDVIGGRLGIGPGDNYALALAYNETRLDAGQCRYIGATDSASPDLIISSSGGGVELIRITDAGDVGIGITSPSYKLDVDAASGVRFHRAANPSQSMVFIADATSNRLVTGGGKPFEFEVSDAYQIGFKTSATERMRISSAGALRLLTYGAGTLTTDASGNVTATSDERMKDNIAPFARGLSDLMKMNPITYNWNAASGLDRLNTYAGFSAQNVEMAIPEAVGVNANGFMSVQERPILAALVNAVKELAARVAALEAV